MVRAEEQYHQLVVLLDGLIDEVGEDEANPLASLLHRVGTPIEHYENKHVIDDKEFDYQTYMKEHDPDVARIHRGTEARQQRFEDAVMKHRVRLDEDVMEQFQQLVPHDQSCEHLINQALREWLAARDVKGLLRDELRLLVQEAFTSAQSDLQHIAQ